MLHFGSIVAPLDLAASHQDSHEKLRVARFNERSTDVHELGEKLVQCDVLHLEVGTLACFQDSEEHPTYFLKDCGSTHFLIFCLLLVNLEPHFRLECLRDLPRLSWIVLFFLFISFALRSISCRLFLACHSDSRRGGFSRIRSVIVGHFFNLTAGVFFIFLDLFKSDSLEVSLLLCSDDLLLGENRLRLRQLLLKVHRRQVVEQSMEQAPSR